MLTSLEQVPLGIYGLAFFTLGLVMAVRTVGHKNSVIVSRMRFLALFGLLHGVFEWTVMFNGAMLFPKLTHSLAAFSFLPLFMFAFWNSPRMVVCGVSISSVLAAIWLASITLVDSPSTLELLARYCIGVPAAISAGVAFLMDRSFRNRVERPSPALIVAAVGFFAYGASQLVSSPVDVAGLPLIETSQFYSATGLPIIAIRAAIAIAISAAALMLMTEFEAIIRRNFDNQLQHAKNLAEQRNVELTEALARNKHLATHDHLTGIANRRGVEAFLKACNGQTAFDEGIAMLHIDLDNFKQINDTLGHASGDRLLKNIAILLGSNVRPGDFVARIGGDEFIVIGQFDNSEANLLALGERLVEVLREPILIEGRPCRCNVSVGVAYEQGAVFDVDQLLLHADTALYRAKRNGKNRIEFFSKEMQLEIIRKKNLADEIFIGIEESEFFPVYQLQFDAKSLDISGVEALARWRHPKRGILSPDSFLGLAEELSVISQIDHDILIKAHQDFSSWSERGFAIPKLSVNISANRLRDNALIESIEEIDFRPGTLSFELLESIFLDDPDEQVADNIHRLRNMGIEIEVDDFGTGHASIVALMKLSPSRLKIDRALITPITESTAQLRLVKSIIDIGLTQGISVTAEGVETMKHVELLSGLGCDTLQGYALARPMPAEDLLSFLAEKAPRQRA